MAWQEINMSHHGNILSSEGGKLGDNKALFWVPSVLSIVMNYFKYLLSLTPLFLIHSLVGDLESNKYASLSNTAILSYIFTVTKSNGVKEKPGSFLQNLDK